MLSYLSLEAAGLCHQAPVMSVLFMYGMLVNPIPTRLAQSPDMGCLRRLVLPQQNCSLVSSAAAVRCLLYQSCLHVSHSYFLRDRKLNKLQTNSTEHGLKLSGCRFVLSPDSTGAVLTYKTSLSSFPIPFNSLTQSPWTSPWQPTTPRWNPGSQVP